MVNFGDRHDVEIEEAIGNRDFKVKDIHTLEHYRLSEITRYGKGKDFEIRDLA